MFSVGVVVVTVDDGVSVCGVFLAGNQPATAARCQNHSIEACVHLQSYTVASHLAVKSN